MYDGEENCRQERRTNQGKSTLKHVFGALIALCAGMVNVLFGGGGGMLLVPGMRYCLGVEEKKAHAGTIAVVLPLSIISAVVFTRRGIFDLGVGLTVSIGAVVGGAVGAVLLRKVPKEFLSLLFYGIMIYAGIRYLV